MKRKVLFTLSLFLVLFLSLPSFVSATSDPDSINIDSAKVFQDIFEDGDWLIIAKYDIEYSITPAEPASSTFLFSLYDADSSLLSSIPLNYYGSNLISIRLSPDTVTALGLSWGEAYTVKVIGNPTYFDDPPFAPQSLAGYYYPTTSGTLSTTDDREGLGAWIISRVKDLEVEWGVTLTTYSEGVTYLNDTGTSYVETAVPGSRDVLDIYQYTVVVPQPSPDVFMYSYQALLYGNVNINFAESKTNWTVTPSDDSDLDTTVDRIEGSYALYDTVSSPAADTNYNMIYDPDNVIVAGNRTLEFFIKSNRASTAYTFVRVYVYDTTNDYKYWNLVFDADKFTHQAKDMTATADGFGGAGALTLTAIDRIMFSIQTADTTGFYISVDSIIARGIPGIGELTYRALEGLGDRFGLSAAFMGSLFFLLIYIVVASIIYMVTGNSVVALAIAIPVILFGNILGIVPLTVVGLIAFLIVLAAGWMIFVG